MNGMQVKLEASLAPWWVGGYWPEHAGLNIADCCTLYSSTDISNAPLISSFNMFKAHPEPIAS